jgi:TRAP-type uncharacterized transport system fused permease subunit
MVMDTEVPRQEHPQPVLILRVIAVVGIALSLFQLYAAGVQPLGLFYQRPIHLGFILVLCFLIYPAFGRHRGPWRAWLGHRRSVDRGLHRRGGVAADQYRHHRQPGLSRVTSTSGSAF